MSYRDNKFRLNEVVRDVMKSVLSNGLCDIERDGTKQSMFCCVLCVCVCVCWGVGVVLNLLR